MTPRSVVHSSPEILGGEPVFAGTRVPVRNLIDYLEHGSSLDDFLADFPSVTREQAVSVPADPRGIRISTNQAVTRVCVTVLSRHADCGKFAPE